MQKFQSKGKILKNILHIYYFQNLSIYQPSLINNNLRLFSENVNVPTFETKSQR